MISISPKHKIYLAIEPINFRNGIDGIARYCKQYLQQDPFSGHYFFFRNKRKTSVKVLYYDSQGFCLFQKRLSSKKFHYWPSTPGGIVTLTPVQFNTLLFNGNPNNTEESGPWKPID